MISWGSCGPPYQNSVFQSLIFYEKYYFKVEILYRRVLQEKNFLLPPIFTKTPSDWRSSLQDISEYIKKFTTFLPLQELQLMEFSLQLSNFAWLMSCIGINRRGKDRHGRGWSREEGMRKRKVKRNEKKEQLPRLKIIFGCS